MQDKYGHAVDGPMDVRVWLRLLSCAMTIEKRLRRKFADERGTTLPRFDVMATLDRQPEGQTMGDLSRALLVSNGNVTATPDPSDRRASIVRLSAAGKAEFDLLADAHHGWIHDAFANFPADKQKQLYELLADLKTSIAKDPA
jgi:DNA-binding MarR family transcriptional regulator